MATGWHFTKTATTTDTLQLSSINGNNLYTHTSRHPAAFVGPRLHATRRHSAHLSQKHTTRSWTTRLASIIFYALSKPKGKKSGIETSSLPHLHKWFSQHPTLWSNDDNKISGRANRNSTYKSAKVIIATWPNELHILSLFRLRPFYCISATSFTAKSTFRHSSTLILRINTKFNCGLIPVSTFKP